jgi:DNA-binding transcriptional ArsR family regulator
MPPTKRQQELRRRTLRPHPARDQIIDVMRSYAQPMSPTRLAKITGATLGSVAYHVRTLVGAGVVELADEGRVRGAVEHFYALVADEEATQLTDPLATLMGLYGTLTVPSTNGDYPRPVALDERARGELRAILDELRPKVRTIVAEASRRAAV